EKFATLQTDIHSDAIPTCICEKSIADKVEKGCLRCGSILGAAMPELGSVGGSLLYALNQWKTYALLETTKYALAKGAAQGAIAGIQAGKGVAIKSLRELGVEQFWPGMSKYILNMRHYSEVADLTDVIYPKKVAACKGANYNIFENMCQSFDKRLGILNVDATYADLPKDAVPEALKGIVSEAESTAKAVAQTESTRIAAEITQQQTAVINATY
ncbi:hypothetical protein PFDG_00459, partial [Plasmodium falciparum Dd2]